MDYYLLFLFTAPIGVVFGFLVGKGRKVVSNHALDQLQKDIPTLIDDYQMARRKASEYFEKIEDVIRERETWRNLYNDQAGGHHNAQALMLQTIANLIYLHKKETGKTPKIDPLIEVVCGDWTQKHGPEVRSTLGLDGRPNKDQAKDSD